MEKTMAKKDKTKKKKNTKQEQVVFKSLKQTIMIIGGFAVILVIAGFVLYLVMNSKNSKLTCKSELGDVTIKYNDKTLAGYTAYRIRYDFDGQKAIADRIGVEAYLQQFDDWFINNTGGTCEREK